jgi:hypothetical protein
LCSEGDSVEGAHIVDAKAKLTPSQLYELDIESKYEVYNGVLLCPNCHCQYDRWKCGIDKDGFKWHKDKDGCWVKDDSVNIFPPGTYGLRRYPSPKLLDWKFQQFVEKRDNIIVRFATFFSSSPFKPK